MRYPHCRPRTPYVYLKDIGGCGPVSNTTGDPVDIRRLLVRSKTRHQAGLTQSQVRFWGFERRAANGLNRIHF